MPPKGATPEEVFQRLLDRTFNEFLSTSPEFIQEWFISNIVRRVIANLFAYDGKNSTRLRCTPEGELLTAPTGEGFNRNDTKSGNAPNSYGDAIVFDEICSRIDITTWDNAAMVKISPDGSNWDDEFEIPTGVIYSIDQKVHSINIKNKAADSVARYQFVGRWYDRAYSPGAYIDA